MDNAHTSIPPLKMPGDSQSEPHKPAGMPRRDKSLIIAVIASFVFLLAAIAIGAWLVTKPAGNKVLTVQAQSDGSDKVTNLTFTPGAGLPAAYARRNQATIAANTAYYFDMATDCGITTVITSISQATDKPKDVALAAAKATPGITTTKTTDGSAIKLADADKQHTYSFDTAQLNQTVSIPGVATTDQTAVIAYKQFGTLVASIEYSCPTGTWDSKKAELQTAVQAFIVKTQK